MRAAPAETVLALAEEIAAGFLETVPKEEPVGLPVFWEMEKRLVRESVRILIEEERLETDGFVPSYFEKWFGADRGGIDVPCPCGGRTLSFHGRIDRIDVAADGRFRVIDYKTGKLMGKDQDIAGGTALQLPVYLMAAARILGAGIETGEARYRHVGTGGGKGAVVFSGSLWEASGEVFTRTVDTIARGIERGVFFAPADPQTCRFCDVRTACVAGASRLFRMKAANDERAREYLDLSCGEEAAE